jgi:hypothetical protein
MRMATIEDFHNSNNWKLSRLYDNLCSMFPFGYIRTYDEFVQLVYEDTIYSNFSLMKDYLNCEDMRPPLPDLENDIDNDNIIQEVYDLNHSIGGFDTIFVSGDTIRIMITENPKFVSNGNPDEQHDDSDYEEEYF